MATPLPPDEIRQRLQLRIEERYHAPLDRKLAGVVARAARIEPTTLATYFGFYPKRRQTQRLHEDPIPTSSYLRSVICNWSSGRLLPT